MIRSSRKYITNLHFHKCNFGHMSTTYANFVTQTGPKTVRLEKTISYTKSELILNHWSEKAKYRHYYHIWQISSFQPK